MKGLTGYFLRYRVSALAVMALLLVFGWFGLQRTRSSFFPEVESRRI